MPEYILSSSEIYSVFLRSSFVTRFSESLKFALLLHRHDELVHDVVFALGRVLAHVEVEDWAGLGARRVFHFAQPHFLADELREFLRADFAQPFEPREFRLFV